MTRGGPLAGIRVVELTKVWAGPYAGKLLSFLGAEAIRVESMEALDVTRVYGVSDLNKAPGFMAVNPEKLSVQINMKKKEGIDLILDLIAKADIVIENLRPGAIERLGLGYERVKAIKPDIIYISMGMWGNDGPLAYQTGYAPCFNALAGLSALVGYEGEAPAGINVRYADSTFGATAAYTATVALLHRKRTGEGQFIDISAVECMTGMVPDAVMDFTLNGVERGCDGNKHAEMAPHGAYPCREGEWISIAVNSDDAWRELASAMGAPALGDDTRFQTLSARKANETELDALVAVWTKDKDAADLAALLQKRAIAAAKTMRSVDLIADPDLWARGFYLDVTLGDGETRPIVGPSWKMSRGAKIARGAPKLGEHNSYVLGNILGFSEEEQRKMTEAGITR